MPIPTQNVNEPQSHSYTITPPKQLPPLQRELDELAKMNHGMFVEDFTNEIAMRKIKLKLAKWRWKNPQLIEKLLICIDRNIAIANEIKRHISGIDPVADAKVIERILHHDDNYKYMAELNDLQQEVCQYDVEFRTVDKKNPLKNNHIQGVLASPFNLLIRYPSHFETMEKKAPADKKSVFSVLRNEFQKVTKIADEYINKIEWRNLKPFGKGFWYNVFASKTERAINKCLDTVRTGFSVHFPDSGQKVVQTSSTDNAKLKTDSIGLLNALIDEVSRKHSAIAVNKKISRTERAKLETLYEQFNIVLSLAQRVPGDNATIEDLAQHFRFKVKDFSEIVKVNNINLPDTLLTGMQRVAAESSKRDRATSFRSRFEALQKTELNSEEAIDKFKALQEDLKSALQEATSPSLVKLQEEINRYIVKAIGERKETPGKPQTPVASVSSVNDLITSFTAMPRETSAEQTERKAEVARMH